MTHPLPRTEDTTRNRGIGVLVLMALLLPPAIWSLSKVDLNNDIRRWLPSDDPNALTLNWYHEYFPESDTALVSWEGSTLNDPRVAWLKGRLRGMPDEDGVYRNGHKLVEKVVTPQDLLRRIEKSGVPHDEALARLQGLLIGQGSLKLDLTEYGQTRKDSVLRKLQLEAKEQLDLELEFSDAVTDWTIGDRADELKLPEQIVEPDEIPEPFAPLREHHAQVRWEGMLAGGETAGKVIELAKSLSLKSGDETPVVNDAFFAPGSPVTVAVVLNEAGSEEKKVAVAAIKEIAAEVGIPEESLRLGGRPVAASALNQSVKRAGWNRDYPITNFPQRSIILFSGLVSIVLAFILLRSVILASLVIGVSYYTVILTTSLVPMFGGSMNMVIAVMPTLLLVLTISGAIHVANYWRFAARSGEKDAPATAVNLARRPCFLASLTTAFGLLSLMTSPLTPVADFGLYSAIGCFVGLGVILYGLPALLQHVPEKTARPATTMPAVWPTVGRLLSKRATLTAVACLLLFGVCSAGLYYFRTETKVIRFFPEGTRIVQDYRWLEENTSGIVPIDIVIRFSETDQFPAEDGAGNRGLFLAERQEIVRKIQNRIVAEHEDVSGALSLATFRPTKTEDELEELKTRRESMKEEAVGLAAIQRGMWTKNETVAVSRFKDPESDVYEQTRNFIVDAEADADLKEPGDNALAKEGDELWRITAQVAIMTDADYGELMTAIDKTVREETSRVAGANHVVTGMVPLFLQTQQAVLSSLIKSFLIAFVVIGTVICILLRSVRAGLFTMLPNVLPISTVFGAISWFSIRVDIGTMITASVALGIAVDGTLHLLTWFRHGIANGRTRRVAISEALDHCGPALCQTSFAVGIGLFVLFPAELLLISRFGWLMAAMIATALFADLVFLPSLLAGRLGSWIMKADVERQMAEADKEAPPFPESASQTPSQSAELAEVETASESDAEPGKTPPNPPHILRPNEESSPQGDAESAAE